MIFETWAKRKYQFEFVNRFYDKNMLHTMVDRVDKSIYQELMVIQKENEIEEGKLIFYQELKKPKVYAKTKVQK